MAGRPGGDVTDVPAAGDGLTPWGSGAGDAGGMSPFQGSLSTQGLSPDVERELVDRARRGEQEAMGLLYDAYLPRLYRYCLKRVGNELDAEDLAEEVFLRVLRSIDGFEWRPTSDGQRIPFGAWLFRIARNHVASHHRRAHVRRESAGLPDGVGESLPDDRRGPLEIVEMQSTVAEVFDLVHELPEAQREVVLLRFAAGLTVAETAEALGKRQGNVKVLQHKGIKRLKELLLSPERQP